MFTRDAMPPKVLHDKQVTGGSLLRGVDQTLSAALGGYRSDKPVSGYGNYVEPILHAAEHTRRAVFHGNATEWARAKDEFRTVGRGGLRNNQREYQTAQQQQKQ